MDEKKCFYCGTKLNPQRPKLYQKPAADYATQDHIIPQALLSYYRINPNTPENMVDACHACNHDKGTLSLSEYRVIRAFRAGLVELPNLAFHAESSVHVTLEKLLHMALA